MTLKILFLGTSGFSVTILDRLIECDSRVEVVATRPDKPAGRKRKITPAPVKERAHELGIDVWQPVRWDSYWLSRAKELAPHFILTAAYGLILPEKLIQIPSLGALNVHPSLLPEYRGAAPIQRSLMDGRTITGVTIQLMSKEIDEGDILLQEKVAISFMENYGHLSSRLADLGGSLAAKSVKLVASGKAQPAPQDHEKATYAPPLQPSEEIINWQEPAVNIYHKIRALSPIPGARTILQGKVLKIFSASLQLPGNNRGCPGEVVGGEKSIIVTAGEGALKIEELQMAGKKKMPAEVFLRGKPDLVGEQLG